MRSWVFWIFLISCMIKNFNWEKSAHLLKTICITVCTHFCWRSRQRYRSLWMSLKKKDLEDELFTRFRYSFVIEITVLWVQRWTEMVPTGFLHNFLEATGSTSLTLPKAIGPSSHKERNSQITRSQIARVSQHAPRVALITLIPYSNLIIISEILSCFSNYFNSTGWRLTCSPGCVLESAYIK